MTNDVEISVKLVLGSKLISISIVTRRNLQWVFSEWTVLENVVSRSTNLNMFTRSYARRINQEISRNIATFKSLDRSAAVTVFY